MLRHETAPTNLLEMGPKCLISILLPFATAEDLHACRNPLFEQHWFSADVRGRSFREFPELSDELRLCPAFNTEKNCCQGGLEHEQALYFAYWRQIFKSKMTRVKQSKQAALAVQSDPIFNSEDGGRDRQQFRSAIQKYDEILDPSAGHARCLSTLLVYVAGMICFGCDPDWKQEVDRGSNGKLLRVLIPEGDCIELWTECAEFGAQARRLREAVLDSSLAMRATSPFEYLQVFEDQQQLCDWAHDVIAMHPFTRPGEAEREGTPPVREIGGRRLDNSSQSFSDFTKEYDVMKQGRSSGFDTSWEGMQARSACSSVDFFAFAVLATLLTLKDW